MNTIRRIPRELSRLRGTGGYSLVELMVAMGVAAIVGLGIYAVFSASRRSGISAKIYNDMQTSCNFALDQMKADLLLSGYHAKNQERPFSVAAGDTVTFEYYDDNARNEAPYATGYLKNTKVTYSLVAGELIRSFQRYELAGADFNAANTTSQTLAKNVAALGFEYLAGGGAAWDGADTKDIRSVRASLTCTAARPDPNTKKTPQLTLVAEVRARNAGVASTPADVIPPGAPEELISWDPGSCGTLQLRWKANADADLEGYTIFYGLQPGLYTDRIVLSRGPKSSGTESYTLTGLSSAVTGVTPQPQYYIALTAYDKSGNISDGYSNEATGNPAPTLAKPTGCDSAACASDTTPTPLVPIAPISLAATSGLNAITLTWTKSTTADLVGYRLYRSTDPAFVPNEDAGTSNRIADETALGVDAVSYTDSGLLGCTTYYYKLATIACDANIPIAGMHFASASSVPTDTTAPSPPTITARPGYRRIILTLTNPYANPDFAYTKIHWSTTANPTLTTVTPVPPLGQPLKVVLDGPPIPDNDTSPYNSSPSFYGWFSKTSTESINFNDSDLSKGSPLWTQPMLVPCTNWPKAPSDACAAITYYFTAVAYDLCGNPSAIGASSLTQADECADCAPEDACFGAPYWPGGVKGQFGVAGDGNIEAEGCFDNMKITWDSIDSTVQDDLAGFLVYRCDDSTVCPDGAGTLLTTEPVWNPEFVDSVPQIENGRTYSYNVRAVDCFYERKLPASGNNYAFDSITDLSVGKIDIDAGMTEAVTGYLLPSTQAMPFTVSAADGLTPVPPTFQHNTVTFWTKNTANSNLTLRDARFSWDNTSAYLQQLSFGDNDTTYVTPRGWADTALPLTSSSAGNTVTLAANSMMLAKDEKIPVVLRFKKADGSVTAATDSREQTIQYAMTYRNESTNTDGCALTGSMYVPRGPYVYGTTQDQPAAGTVAWPVPGPSGTNARNVITAQGGTGVTVYTNVFDSAGDGLLAVKLYYYVDAGRTLTAAPTVSTQFPDFTPPYPAAIDMERVAGNQWRTPPASKIPASDGKNVWYFIVAVDSHGNFDRDPEIDSGAYQYFQQPADSCLTTPRPPILSGTVSGTTVNLSWTAPVANTNGTSYIDAKGYWIYRSKDGGSFSGLATINDKNTLTYTTTIADLSTASYRFLIYAFDQCLPTPKPSVASNYFTETVEGACESTPNAPALSGVTDGTAGTVTLTWTPPAKNTSGSDCTDLAGYKIYRRTGTNTPTLYVPGAGGSFTGPGGSLPATTLTYTDPPSPPIANLQTEDYSYYIAAFDTCSPTAKESPLSLPYIDTYNTLDPCTTIPGNVSGLTGTVDTTTKEVTLTWAAPTTQSSPAGTPYNDPGGFHIAKYKDGVYTGLTVLLPESQLSYTDSSVAADVGTSVYRYYIKAKDMCSPPKYSPVWVYWDESFSAACESVNPGPPLSLTVNAAATDSSGVSLTWSNPSPIPGDLQGYVVERKDVAVGVWAEIAVPFSPLYYPVNAVKDTTVNPAQAAFCYRLKSFDSCATPNYGTVYSNEACEVYDPCGTPPDAPTALTAGVASGNVNLSWTAPPATTANQGLSGYEIFRQMNTCGWGTDPVGDVATTTYQDPTVTASLGVRAYSYRVRSYKSCGAFKLYSTAFAGPANENDSTSLCTAADTFSAPATPGSFAAAEPGGTDKCRKNPGDVPDTKNALLTWTSAGAPAGVTKSFGIYYCDGACTLTCDTLGCFTDAGFCTPALTPTPATTTSGTGVTVAMPDFLATHSWKFTVPQIYTKATCKKVSTPATTTDTCN